MVDFAKNIGVDGSSGLATRYGTIHLGKNGAHIVPEKWADLFERESGEFIC
ncbi:hypothetical protein JFT63_08980 [Pseudomonas sp. MF7453]|nr:hypothetical protein [Pseudomonas sp. MF7453]